MFPFYLSLGMSYGQFWEEEPELAGAYRKADELRRRRQNEVLWLQGIYVAKALECTVGNMLGGKRKLKYPEAPLPITAGEAREKREREQRQNMERIRASFTARALGINARMTGGERHDGRGEAEGAAGAAGPGQ